MNIPKGNSKCPFSFSEFMEGKQSHFDTQLKRSINNRSKNQSSFQISQLTAESPNKTIQTLPNIYFSSSYRSLYDSNKVSFFKNKISTKASIQFIEDPSEKQMFHSPQQKIEPQQIQPRNHTKNLSIQLNALPQLATDIRFKYNEKIKTNKKDILDRKKTLQQQLKQITQIKRNLFFDEQKHSIKRPSSQIIKLFLDSKFSDNKKKVKQIKGDEFIGAERIDEETEILFKKFLNDPCLAPKFRNINLESLKQTHQRVLGLAFNRQLHLDYDYVRMKHVGMELQKKHFDKMKYHFINQMLEMKTQPQIIAQSCLAIESFRPHVLNRPSALDIIGKEQGVQEVARLMYKKIFADYILSEFFENISLDQQAIKFSKLFAQLLNTIDSPNYSLFSLRERHIKYRLTHVHFANFKLYLSLALQEKKVPNNLISQILSTMDGFKWAILNKDSIKDLIDHSQGGFTGFISQFIQMCQADPSCAALIAKRGVKRFTQHAENMFQYFFHRFMNSITQRDLKTIHNFDRYRITPELFEKFKQKSMTLVQSYNPEQMVINDFEEEWNQIKSYICCDPQPFKRAGGWVEVENLVSYITRNVSHQILLNKIFRENEIHMLQNISIKMYFILCGSCFYKKSDLIQIHKRLRINNFIFDEFLQSVKISIDEYNPNLLWMITHIESYRQFIVQE